MRQVAEGARHAIGEPLRDRRRRSWRDCSRTAGGWRGLGRFLRFFRVRRLDRATLRLTQPILLRLSRSCEAFAMAFSRAISSLNRASAPMARQIRSRWTLPTLRSASAPEEDALNPARGGPAAPSRLSPRPAWPLARRQARPPSSASEENAPNRSKRRPALSPLSLRPAWPAVAGPPAAALPSWATEADALNRSRRGRALSQLSQCPAWPVARLPALPPSSAPEPEAPNRSKRGRVGPVQLASRPA